MYDPPDNDPYYNPKPFKLDNWMMKLLRLLMEQKKQIKTLKEIKK